MPNEISSSSDPVARYAAWARRLGTATATLLVVASMVGTGVFTTTGLLLRDIQSPVALLLTWLGGGLVALCGALAYGELVAMYPANGGEYLLLSKIYHPAVGFVAGCVSFIVGFSAPIAASALAFGYYVGALFPQVPTLFAAWALVVYLSMIHVARVSMATWAQNAFTVGKIVLMLVFVAGGLFSGDVSNLASHETPGELARVIMSPSFAMGLVVVSFAYSGWNAATYIAGELRRPSRSLPIALVLGTAAVVILYLCLNIVFLMAAPTDKLRGVVEVGHVAAVSLFGSRAGKLLSAAIALGLVSTVGAFIMTGPRVYEAMGNDYPALRFLTLRMRDGGPAVAIALQAAVSLLMIVTSSFDVLLTYVGFTLSAVTGLTVFGVLVMRVRRPNASRPYRTWGYPFTPIAFVALMIWIIIQAVRERPAVALSGALTAAAATILYAIVRPRTLGGKDLEAAPPTSE